MSAAKAVEKDVFVSCLIGSQKDVEKAKRNYCAVKKLMDSILLHITEGAMETYAKEAKLYSKTEGHEKGCLMAFAMRGMMTAEMIHDQQEKMDAYGVIAYILVSKLTLTKKVALFDHCLNSMIQCVTHQGGQ